MRKFRCAGRPMTLVVLAGGRSRRMGRDKAFLPVGDGVLLERVVAPLAGFFDEVVVSASSRRRAAAILGRLDVPGLAARLLPAGDEVPGQGPLRGLLTGLRAARNEACFVLAADMPDVKPSAVRALSRRAAGRDCAVAVGPDGYKEPLLGVYMRSVIPAVEGLLSSGRRSLLDLYPRVRSAFVGLGPELMPANINTPEDYRAFIGKRVAGDR